MATYHKAYSIVDGRKCILLETSSWLGRLFGYKPKQQWYAGDCTVWHKHPTGERASSGFEGFLSELDKAAQFQGIWKRLKEENNEPKA